MCTACQCAERSVRSPAQEQESTCSAFSTAGGMQARSDSEGWKCSSTWEPRQEDSFKCQSTLGYIADPVSLGKERAMEGEWWSKSKHCCTPFHS